MCFKQKLIDFINRRFNFKASDADYEYSAALYHIRFDKVPEDEKELEEYNTRIAEYNKFATEYEQQHPVDAIDRREEMDKLAAKKHITCFDELKFVKPNRHVGEDICSHPFTGSYEHKDENGNWSKVQLLVTATKVVTTTHLTLMNSSAILLRKSRQNFQLSIQS